MDAEEARPPGEGAGMEGLGGPSEVILASTPDNGTPWLGECSCREAVLLRLIASGELPLPGSGSFKTLATLVKASAVRRLRAMSHDLAEGMGPKAWTSMSHAALEQRRNTYERPGRTPEQIRAEVAYSWRQFNLDRQNGRPARQSRRLRVVTDEPA